MTSLDSLIIKNKDDKNKFFRLISRKIKINAMKLLYRSTRDGLTYQNVVNKINNKSNLIFILFTGNKRIFGSFKESKLDNIQHKKFFKDENAFVFSLDNNKIYEILIPGKAIYFLNGYPILIGNDGNRNGFWLNDNNFNNSNECLVTEPKIYNFQKKNELFEGLNTLTLQNSLF